MGVLAVAPVEGALGDEGPLRVHVLLEPACPAARLPAPTPACGGFLALLLVQTLEEPVELRAVSYAPPDASSGLVLGAVGAAEHWPEWRAAARAWPEEVEREAPARPYWQAAGPTPPLTQLAADDLGMALGPRTSALIAIGEWSFQPPNAAARHLERLTSRLGLARSGLRGTVLSYPALSYVSGGAERRMGLVEPIVLFPARRR